MLSVFFSTVAITIVVLRISDLFLISTTLIPAILTIMIRTTINIAFYCHYCFN